MATLTLQVDDEVLTRANAAVSRMRQGSLETVLLARVHELGDDVVHEDPLQQMRRLFTLADERGFYLEGGMPTADERNER